MAAIFALHPYIEQYSHLSFRAVRPQKHGFNRWNCVAIMYISWNIRVITIVSAAILDFWLTVFDQSTIGNESSYTIEWVATKILGHPLKNKSSRFTYYKRSVKIVLYARLYHLVRSIYRRLRKSANNVAFSIHGFLYIEQTSARGGGWTKMRTKANEGEGWKVGNFMRLSIVYDPKWHASLLVENSKSFLCNVSTLPE